MRPPQTQTTDDDLLSGGQGNDFLIGDMAYLYKNGQTPPTPVLGYGNDILTGGPGDDTLMGEGGDDAYVFEQSGGMDVIQEGVTPNFTWDATSQTWKFTGTNPIAQGGNDTLFFGPGQDSGKFVALPVGNDLRVWFVDQPQDQVDIVGQFNNDQTARIESFFFGDNVTITSDQLSQTTPYLPSGVSFVTGPAGTDNTLDGSAGNALVEGQDGNDALIGGANDTLIGGAGNDTYQVDLRQGQSYIQEDPTQAQSNSGNDTLKLEADVSLSDLNFSKDAAGNLTISLASNPADAVTIIREFNASHPGDRVESLQLQSAPNDPATLQTYQLLNVGDPASPLPGETNLWMTSDNGDTLQGAINLIRLAGEKHNDMSTNNITIITIKNVLEEAA